MHACARQPREGDANQTSPQGHPSGRLPTASPTPQSSKDGSGPSLLRSLATPRERSQDPRGSGSNPVPAVWPTALLKRLDLKALQFHSKSRLEVLGCDEATAAVPWSGLTVGRPLPRHLWTKAALAPSPVEGGLEREGEAGAFIRLLSLTLGTH